MSVLEISRSEARKIAIQAQMLDGRRPEGLLPLVRHLTLLQIDPVAAVAPSADLVAWSRLGPSYQPEQLVEALQRRELIELRAMIRPAEDVALYLAEMAAWPGTGELSEWRRRYQEWVNANHACRRDILDRLDASGPLRMRDLPDTCAVPWKSTGWTNNRSVGQLLELMAQRGEVAIAGRQGRERLWDLASRVYPDAPIVALEEARRIRDRRRLRSLGIVRSTGPECPVEPLNVADVGERAVVDGVPGEWLIDRAYLRRPFEGRVALLSPFDRLVYDRKRTLTLFDFDYQLEMYKPAARRRWGYYALPILFGDRLIGKVDATADQRAGILRVHAIHADSQLDVETQSAVEREVTELAGWLGLDVQLSSEAAA